VNPRFRNSKAVLTVLLQVPQNIMKLLPASSFRICTRYTSCSDHFMYVHYFDKHFTNTLHVVVIDIYFATNSYNIYISYLEFHWNKYVILLQFFYSLILGRYFNFYGIS